MAIMQGLTKHDYERFILSGVEGQWELHDGRLVEKPGMSWKHLDLSFELGHQLRLQLDRDHYRVFIEGRVLRHESTILQPGLLVVPTEYGDRIAEHQPLAVLPAPLPLVVEVWSPSTGEYDLDTKIPVYIDRGDQEVWRIHPYERTLTRWVRQPDGSYVELLHRDGMVALAAFPGVVIDLDQLMNG